MNILRILDRNSSFYGNRLAVVDEKHRITYRELNDRVYRLVNSFKQAGLTKGDKVAILGTNCAEYLECMQACLRGGYVCVPINHRLTADNIVYLLNNSQSKALLVQDKFFDVISCNRQLVKYLKQVIVLGSYDPLPDWAELYDKTLAAVRPMELNEKVEDNDLAFIIYTSGTSGLPKSVMYTRKIYYEVIKTWIGALGLNGSDVGIIIMPLFHMGGNALASAIACVAGINIMMDSFDPNMVVEVMSQEKVTIIALVPTMIASLLSVPNLTDFNLNSLKTIFYAASPIPLSLLRKAMSSFGQDRFIQLYGLTECPPVTFLGREQHIRGVAGDAAQFETQRLESVGVPYFSNKVKIVDEQGKELPTGMAGEIIVSGETVTSGYWEQPALTAQKLRDGWLHTGDIGRFDADGYLYIIDRKEDMIISGGENIYPNEVESVLCGHPAVQEAAVVGLPDEKWGEAVTAVVVLWSDKMASEEELMQYCKKRLASYKKPKNIIKFESLPKSASGKILRRSVRLQLLKD